METACCTHLHSGLFFHFWGRCEFVSLHQQPCHRSNPSVQRWQRYVCLQPCCKNNHTVQRDIQTNKLIKFQWLFPYNCPCLYDFVPKEKMEAAFCTHLHNGLFFHFRGRCVCVGLQQQPRHRSNPSVQRWQRSQQRSQAASIATGLHRGSLWQILTAFGWSNLFLDSYCQKQYESMWTEENWAEIAKQTRVRQLTGC